MATETATGWRRYTEIRTDWVAFTLVGLFVLVIGGSMGFYPFLVESGTESAVSGASTSKQAGGGLVWAIAEAIFAGLLLGLIVLFRRAPTWIRAVIRRALPVAFWVVVGLYTAGTLGWQAAFVGVPLLVVVIEAAKYHDLYWILNDVFGLTIAVVGAATIGLRFGPVVVAVGLVGLSLYDYYFADQKTWMFDLAEWMVRWKVPALVILPTTLRFDWERLADAGDDIAADDIGMGLGIGVADLLLPAALAVGLATTGGGLPVVGVMAGTLAACFRLSHKMHRRGGAGLPAITTGALGGWAVAATIAILGGL